MQAVTSERKPIKKRTAVLWLMLVAMAVLMIAAIATPNLLRSRIAADQASSYARQQRLVAEGRSFQDSLAMADARQVIRTAEMSLLVDDPAKRMEEVTAVATRLGGFVETSQIWRAESGGSAQMTLRVPADRLQEARAAIRGLAKKVESEKTGATDVTAQAVDLDATLRNYRAEEQQYLGIMQRAGTVKDTLDVAQRLSDVRGRIERTEAQLKLLSRQVAMATITVSLRAETLTQVQWMPNIRQAWNGAAESMAAYVASMMSLLLYAPVVLAWFFTVVALLALAWKTLRWLWTRWFAVPQVSRA
jgi:hypothetical protein